MSNSPQAKDSIPLLRLAYRTFLVRRYNPVHTAEKPLEEITVAAHVVQYDAPSTVLFLDVVEDPEIGVYTQIHRIFFDVLDVEEVMRIPPPKKGAHGN